MTAPQWCPDDRLLSLGLTFMRDEQFGLRSIGHGGGVSGGWNTHIDLFPSEDLAVLVHINIYFDKSEEIFSRIIQAVLNAPDPDFSGCRTDAAILAAAPGVYEPPEGFLTSYRIIRSTGTTPDNRERRGAIPARQTRTMARGASAWRSPIPEIPRFFVLDTGAPDPPRLVFVQDGNGRPTAIQMSRMNFVRNDNLTPWVE